MKALLVDVEECEIVHLGGVTVAQPSSSSTTTLFRPATAAIKPSPGTSTTPPDAESGWLHATEDKTQAKPEGPKIPSKSPQDPPTTVKKIDNFADNTPQQHHPPSSNRPPPLAIGPALT